MMMTDDRFDDAMRDAARSYHEPPATPREQMWERIAAARQVERERTVVVPPQRNRFPWWMAIAATLLVGIAIGRFAMREDGAAVDHIAVRADSSPMVVAAGPVEPDSITPEPVGESRSEIRNPRPTPPGTVERATQRTMIAEVPRTARPGGNGESPSATDMTGLYRQVAYETMGQAEALLTVYRAEERPEARARVAAWARDVLTSTRLLLDSPAMDDPQLATLLRDLELVLAQIAALESESAGEADREMIDDAIRQRDVLPRIRTVIPAGLSAGAST